MVDIKNVKEKERNESNEEVENNREEIRVLKKNILDATSFDLVEIPCHNTSLLSCPLIDRKIVSCHLFTPLSVMCCTAKISEGETNTGGYD